jgi:3,4-dihydroxy-9,10-secoandrosta-1,3,5(10)-triene-9,17-dione 4,5-dioxygenase
MRVTGLSYVGINATDPDAWRSFGTELLGLAIADDPGDAHLRLRMDERPWRLAVHASDRSGLAYVGWEIPGSAEFAEAVTELESLGIDVAVDHGNAARERCARGLARFEAPGGHQLELVYGASFQGHFVSPLGVRFRTGDLGMGHVVIVVPEVDFDDAMHFYMQVMGFRVSEYLDFGPVAGALMHCGPRHHALGVVRGGRRAGCDHILLEVEHIDDVGRCWDRALASGVDIRRMIGRHADDHMLSFYMATPSKIGVEYGTGGRVIDPDTWSSETLRTAQAGDSWGHQAPPTLSNLVSRPDGA